MIGSVEVRGFKAIGADPVSLELRPLTLLVGPNGSGKSTMLEAVALLVQSIRPRRRIGLVWDGPLVNLGGDTTPLYHGNNTDQPLHVQVSVQPPGSDEPIRVWFSVRGETADRTGDWEQGIGVGAREVVFQREAAGPGAYRKVARLSGAEPAVSVNVSGSIDAFLDRGLFVASGTDDPELQGRLLAWQPVADRAADALAPRGVRYLSALRGGPLMNLAASKDRPRAAGRYGEDTIRLLSSVKAEGHRSRREYLERTAHRFGLGDLQAGWSGGEQLTATFEDPGTGVRLPVFQAGFGAQQALPAIVDFADAEPGTTVMIEELEHSCHPDWVSEWGIVLAETVRDRQVQIVGTTHAPDLVLAVFGAIRRGIIDPGDVVVYEFRREGGVVRASRVELDRRGLPQRGWIRSFAEAESRLFDGLLDEVDDSSVPPDGTGT